MDVIVNLEKKVNDLLLREEIKNIFIGSTTIDNDKLILHDASLSNAQIDQINNIVASHDYKNKSQSEIKREQYMDEENQAITEAKNALTVEQKVDVMWKYLGRKLQIND